MLAQGCILLILQLTNLRASCRNHRVLPGAGEQRQLEADLQADHVAEVRATTLIIHPPRPIRLLFCLGLVYLGLRLACHGVVGIELRVGMYGVQVFSCVYRPEWERRRPYFGVLPNPALQRGSRLSCLTQ
ncbi:hypothetical protein D3C84_882050 [compost metagenome]